ncbi:cytochrome P450 [Mycena maculata]|uniref:Cytochrome P450 n=1 Tax=Mycena maculata TaxID=230809 RepID=A0AAD7N1A6_9AGAR|nr:cytochrome P450 [Mycena maculata]
MPSMTMPSITLPTTWNVGAVDAGVLVASVSVFYILVRRVFSRSSTALKGPSSSNFFFGMMPYIMKAPDSGAVYEEWAATYGSVFSIPALLGRRTVILTDPKALQHFFSRETYGYVQTPNSKRFLEKLIGRGLFWAEGDSHKRQRRALNPAFSPNSIKNLTPIFFDSAYKAKSAWDALLESNPSDEGAIIEVQEWMNHISLDTIGLAGFSHDFGALSGRTSTVAVAFDSIGLKPSLFDTGIFLASLIIPVLADIPTGRRVMLDQLGKTMRGLADKFLAADRDTTADKSVIGLLVKSASTERITQEEVIAQINVLLLAGYETTAISLTWALIELSRNPAAQIKLRDEILQAGGDPSWDELTNGLPFLDAVTCEILRLHPPLPESQRMAAEDDILPLSAPLETAGGVFVESVFIRKGTMVTLPIKCINRSVEFWGPDAKVFSPARWLNPSADPHRAQEIAGYRHLLTFSDGARMCLGKGFALAEFKSVLSVLIRTFTFELPKGPDTVIGQHRNILPRPKVEGEEGYAVPLRVRHYVAE